MAKGSIPVLVGVGQSMSQWDGSNGPVGAPSPLSLMTEASIAALANCGTASAEEIASAIDTVAVVRIFEDSIGRAPHPHGHNKNLPGTLARNLKLRPKRRIYAAVGGQSPQELLNEMAARIHSGEIDAALISGSEANKASKAAVKRGMELNWADDADVDMQDRGLGPLLLSRPEVKHGLIAPAYFYGLFENAIAAREGRTRAEHRAAMAKLFSPFSKVAAANPYAQFPTARDEAFLSTPSQENYEYADPFLKWFIAQDAVNQGAAVIIMSEEKADTLNIPAGQRIYLHGAGEAGDDFLSERPKIDGSWAMQTALDRALTQSDKSPDDLKHLDLYSCFPCAVFSSTAALGIDWRSDPRALTLTGGLPFFGGPGNNYSLHGIAEMVGTLRDHSEDFGLVLANGGWMTKEAVGVYSAIRPDDFTPVEAAAKPTDKVELVHESGEVKLESFTIAHGRAGPQHGILFCRRSDGARTLAQTSPAALMTLNEGKNPIGRRGKVEASNDMAIFDFAE
jgi:acetyl-CoA C-acetyltransferase